MQNWSSKLKFRSKIGTVHIPPVDIPPVGDPEINTNKTFENGTNREQIFKHIIIYNNNK